MFIALSVHIICLHHVGSDAVHRAVLSATADPCNRFSFFGSKLSDWLGKMSGVTNFCMEWHIKL